MRPIAARVALRYRLAQRYRSARDLERGTMFQTELVRIQYLHEVLVVTDLSNAGKRGKIAPQMRVTLTANFEGDRRAWFDDLAEEMVRHSSRGYQAIRDLVAFLKSQDPSSVAVDIEHLKAVRVEPYGEIFKFMIRQPDGGHIEVKVSPTDFHVIDHAFMAHPTDPEAEGHFQDTSYWPRGKTDAIAFYGWMKANHERARRFMNMNVFRQTWHDLGIRYNSH